MIKEEQINLANRCAKEIRNCVRIGDTIIEKYGEVSYFDDEATELIYYQIVKPLTERYLLSEADHDKQKKRIERLEELLARALTIDFESNPKTCLETIEQNDLYLEDWEDLIRGRELVKELRE